MHNSGLDVVAAEVATDIAVVTDCALPPASFACPLRGDVISKKPHSPLTALLNVQVKEVWPPTALVLKKQSPSLPLLLLHPAVPDCLVKVSPVIVTEIPDELPFDPS